MLKGIIGHLKKTEERLENNQKMNEEFTDHQKQMFDKYANKYKVDANPVKEALDNVDREKYVYLNLCEKGLENTGIEKLLDMTLADIQQQYSIKQDMEYKAGFMTALWGVLIAAVLQGKIYIKPIDNLFHTSLNWGIKGFGIMVFLGLLVSGVTSMFFISKTLLEGNYRRYVFDEKDINFRCAVDDKNMLLTRLLDSNTTIWIKNEDANQKKYKNLRLLIIWIGMFIIFIIICLCIQ